MADYRLIDGYDGVIRTIDMATIPPDDANHDWKQYQRWLEEGGVPDPALPGPPVEKG